MFFTIKSFSGRIIDKHATLRNLGNLLGYPDNKSYSIYTPSNNLSDSKSKNINIALEQNDKFKSRAISFVIPTLNEEAGIEAVIGKIQDVFSNNPYEIIIVDGNSTDRTVEIATRKGAMVLPERGSIARRGYGNALKQGIEHVCERSETSDRDIIVILDGDNTYLPKDIPALVQKIHETGAALVLGDRFAHMVDGAMTVRNRLGNKIITLIFNLLYHEKINDTQCGLRVMTVGAMRRMELVQDGMPFATEMLMEAKKYNFKIAQVPINYDLRAGKAKLSPILDGFRIIIAILDFFTGYRKTKFFHRVQALGAKLLRPFETILRLFKEE